MFISSSDITLNLTIFSNHFAGDSGGSLYVQDVVYGWGASLTLWQCNFTGNIARNFGGAVYVKEGGVQFYGVLMKGNVAGQMGSSVFIESSLAIEAASLQIEHDCALGISASALCTFS